MKEVSRALGKFKRGLRVLGLGEMSFGGMVAVAKGVSGVGVG